MLMSSAKKINSYGGNISSLRRKDCAQLFFVYAGDLGKISLLSPMRFIRESGLANRNVTFIRDPHTWYYEYGVGGDIQSLDALIDWHQRFIHEQPHLKEVYCVGNSSGGYAALMFGYLLAVRTVWAFVPAGAYGLPLLRELLEESNGVTQYQIFYGPSVSLDRVFAETLGHCPGVTLIPCEGVHDSHALLRSLVDAGELAGLFPPFVSAAA